MYILPVVQGSSCRGLIRGGLSCWCMDHLHVWGSSDHSGVAVRAHIHKHNF